jgi:nitrite reductase (NADH) large subunit
VNIVNITIVGSGVAGITAARTLRVNDPTSTIDLYTDENYLYYPRPRLYDILSGDMKPQETYVFSKQWYEKKSIHLHLNEKLLSIDPVKKTLLLEGRKRVTFDKLLLAHGAHPFVPPIKGVEKTGVFTLRSMKDALTIKNYAQTTRTSIIIGGGLLGLEFAASLRKLGQQVKVVELFSRLCPKQLDHEGALILKNRLETRGIRFALGVKTREIIGEKKASGIMLETGKTIDGSLILISAGARSNTNLAVEAGLNVNRGIIVNRYLQTSIDDIYAAGDVAEFDGTFYGSIPAAMEQAKLAAVNILAQELRTYNGTVPSHMLKIVGIDLTSMGLVNPESSRYEEIRKIDQENGIYKKIVLEQGIIVGAILLGNRRGNSSIKTLMDQRIDITKHKDSLLNNNFDYRKILS